MKIREIDNYKIAFVGWNPFQLLHVKTLLLSMPNSVFVIEKRVDKNIEFFSNELLKDIESQIIILNQNKMQSLDVNYDVIIVQTLFRDIEKIKKSKIVMLQYGYAKEPHNYGTWRALASLCLTYGEYASAKISLLSPTVETGNPRYDIWHDNSFHQDVRAKYREYIDPNRKSILYLPTWGELSSFSLYMDSIANLAESYNLLVKLHHNTDYLELDRVADIKKRKIAYFGANDDILGLISISDIVISDYSGAIFDAIYCNKSIVLLDLPKEKLLASKKIDIDSLEFSQRDTLGTRVSSALELKSTIDNIAQKEQEISPKLKRLKEELFVKTTHAKENIHSAIINLMNGEYKKTQAQIYINRSIVELYSKKTLWDIFRRRLIEIYLYILSFRRKNVK